MVAEHRCKIPHRALAEMFDGNHLRRCQIRVGADLRVKVIAKRSTGYVALQPVGDPLTTLLVAHVVFARHWEAA